MLQKMVLTNFLSFRERTEFDFTPSRYGILNKTNVSSTDVLKGALFIGPNASGKTNALKGLKFLIDFICGEATPITAYRCVFGGEAIIGAEYTFCFQGQSVFYQVSYDPKKSTLYENLKLNDKQVLQRAGKQGQLHLSETPIIDDQLDEMTSFLRTASFNTGRFPQNRILRELMDYIVNSYYIDGYCGMARLGATASRFAETGGIGKLNQYLEAFHYDFTAEYGSESTGARIQLRIGSNGGKEQKVLFLKRNGYPCPFDIYHESQGNQVFIDLLPNLIRVIEKPGMLAIDEFGNSLHDDLEEKIVRFFMKKADQSQLFITSHSTNLISNSVFRPDQINLITFAENQEKKDMWSSHTVRLSRFKPREAQNMEKMYLSGMFGGLPNYGEEV